MTYSSFGWQGKFEAFLEGSALYAEEYDQSGTRYDLEPQLVGRARDLGAGEGANLTEWSAAVNPLFAAGCESQALAVLSSFAAPLMALHKNPRSLLVALYGTMRCKKTALVAAASVWGMPEGLRIDPGLGGNRRLAQIGDLGNLPCFFDELMQRDPAIVARLCWEFALGNAPKEVPRWATLGFTRSIGAPEPSDEAARPIWTQVWLSCWFPKEEAVSSLKARLLANRGVAGDRYLRYLVKAETVQWVSARLEKYARMFKANQPDERYKLRILWAAAVIVASELVAINEIIEHDTGRFIEYLRGEESPLNLPVAPR